MLLAALVGLTGAILGVLVADARRRRHPAVGRRVLVNLDDGAVRGFLVRQYGDWVILHHAEWLQADGQRAPLDGDLVLERRRIQFLQILTT
jgi:hypothetical protein